MREADCYRYFLGFRPNSRLCRLFAALGREAGQSVRLELLHLTLCVIAETAERDPFLLRRVQAALTGQGLSSFPVRFGRLRSGPHGASIRTVGRQDDIQDFYRSLLRLLAARDIAPLHRKSGLRAHVTLGYEACAVEEFHCALEWFPDELLLIESEVGRSRHNVLGRWPLLPPPQAPLPFACPLSPSLQLAS